MTQKHRIHKMLAVLTGISLLIASPGLPAATSRANTDTTVPAISGTPEIRTVNLNLLQEDGSYAIAGISDPGQPVKSQLAEGAEADAARNNNWGEETDAEGNVTKSGRYVYYGSYQQGSDGNGGFLTEPLKWRVLDADTQDFNAEGDTSSHKMLLLSDKVLDQVNFNETHGTVGVDKQYQIYGICNLRKWFNSEPFEGSYLEGGFLDNAFVEAERNGISTSYKIANDEAEISDFSKISKDTSGLSQNGLTDKIFALSAEEANLDAYGFYHINGNKSQKTRLLTATDYAKTKNILPTTREYKNWWLRSRAIDSMFSAGCIDSTGWIWANVVDCIQPSNGSPAIVGVAPAFNIDLSAISFSSASGTGKSDFALTSASDSKEWNLTMAGGSDFEASRNKQESGVVKPGGTVTIDISSTGTPDSGVAYTQLSAILADKDNNVTAYGRIADIDAPQAEITIPGQTASGDYILKIFAEDVNSSATQNQTDFASNMSDIPITVDDAYTISVTNPADSHITYSVTPENGTPKQGVAKTGGSYTKVIYTAGDDYYFPEDYSVTGENGITVTRDSASQITVSGTPTGDASLTLAAATEKDSQAAPEGLAEAEGQITGTDTSMEYRQKPEDENDTDTGWTDCRAGFTEVSPGTYQIRYKETDTKKTGATSEVTVLTRYTLSVTNPADSHILHSGATDNGAEQQKVTEGDAITSIIYMAGDGYYFPDTYTVPDQNGITVTRDSISQITISGTPTGDVILTLAAATEKGSQAAPEGLGETEGLLTGTDISMEYRLVDENGTTTEWTDCTTGFTEVPPGTYQIRYKETDTKKAGTAAEITVLARYMVSITSPADSHILHSGAAANGTEQQKTAAGKAITSVVYTAEDGYYFPDNYTVAGQNGITITRDSDTQITVSGIPTGNVNLILAAAARKPEPTPTPTATATPTPEPVPTASATPEPVPTASATPEPVPTASVTPGTDPTPAATATATPGTVPLPTATTTPTPGTPPAPTATASATPGTDPTPTVTASATPGTVPLPTADPSPVPPSTVQPTQKPDTTAVPPDDKTDSDKPDTRIDGYDIFAVPCGKKLTARSLIKTVNGEKTSSTLTRTAQKKLTGKKSYKIKIKAFQLADGKKIYLNTSRTYHMAGTRNKKYTNAKKIKISKKTIRIKKGKTSRINAKIVKQSKKKKLLPRSHGPALRYSSTNTKIATVTSKGKIRAKKKGTCYINITALNGISARVKVTIHH